MLHYAHVEYRGLGSILHFSSESLKFDTSGIDSAYAQWPSCDAYKFIVMLTKFIVCIVYLSYIVLIVERINILFIFIGLEEKP